MESYRISGIPNTGLAQSYTQPSRTRGQSNGTYGLSIRVQGIDGHPFVVLNNQDRGPNPYGGPLNNNGYVDSENIYPHSYEDYEYKNLSEGPFLDYRHQMPHGGPHNGTSDAKKQSSLLNFQKHPELLKPYDPQSNTLNNFARQPVAEVRNPYASPVPRANSPVVSQARTSSLDRLTFPDGSLPDGRRNAQSQVRPQTLPVNVQSQTRPSKDQVLTQPQVKPQGQAQSQVKPTFKTPPPYQAQPSQRLPVPQASTTVINPYDQTRAFSRPPSSVSSTNSSLERSRREPDVLPLRRVDSSGPVLQSSSSRKSSLSSTTPTKEDQLDQLYADNINRHGNRRYIPFLPGTGRDIDTGSIPGVDELIKKFDSKDTYQRRGRSGRRNRLNPEDRKRSRSVDSALPFGLEGDDNYLDEVSRNRGRSTEHLLRPSLLLQKGVGAKASTVSPPSTRPRINVRNTAQVSSAPGSPQGTDSNSSAAILGYKNPQSRPSVVPVENKNEEVRTSQSRRTLSSVTTGSISRPAVNGKAPNSEVDAQVRGDGLLAKLFDIL